MVTLASSRRQRLKAAFKPHFTFLNDFLDWMPKDSPYKYEWNRGRIERTDYMKFDERILINHLIRRFIQTKAFQEGGMLFAEVDVHLGPDLYRRPDAAYLTQEQISGSTDEVKWAVPSFIID